MGLKSRLYNPLSSYFSGLTKTRLSIPSQDLVIPDQFMGIELEIENVPRSLTRNPAPSGWVAKTDGSLRGSSLEYVSDGPVCGQQLMESVSRLMGELQANDCSIERNASFRTSTHVHVDFTRTDPYVNMPPDSFHGAQQVVVLYWMLEDLFFAVAGEHRRRSGYSFQFDDAPGDLSRFLGVNNVYATMEAQRYYGLNFKSLSKFGTLEFRHMPLLLDREQLMRWLRTIMRLKLWAYTNLREDTGTAPRFDLTASTDGVAEAAEFVMSEYPHALSALDMGTVSRRVEDLGIWQEIAASSSRDPYESRREFDEDDDDDDREPAPDPDHEDFAPLVVSTGDGGSGAPRPLPSLRTPWSSRIFEAGSPTDWIDAAMQANTTTTTG